MFIDQEKKNLKELDKKKREALQKISEVDENGNPIEHIEFKEVSEASLCNNEWLDIKQKQQAPPRRPKIKPVDYNSNESGGSSEETEEEFDWYNGASMDDESYFCFVNNTRRTLEAGE